MASASTGTSISVYGTQPIPPLLSLPNEIIRSIALVFLDSWTSNPEHIKARPIAPVSFDVDLRNVCSTSRRLRDVCRSLLYRNAWVSVCGIRGMEGQRAHIGRKLLADGERCGFIRHARLRDNVRGHLEPSSATDSNPRYPYIRQIIQDLITSLPNLQTFELSGTFVGLTADVLSTINAHSVLHTVMIEDGYQLSTLPDCKSLSRIRCRSLGKYLTSSSWNDWPDYFTTDKDTDKSKSGAQVESLHLDPTILDVLGSTRTLHGLRSITLDRLAFEDLALPPNGTTFLERHTSLETITLDGPSSYDLQSLSWLPCIEEMHTKAQNKGLNEPLVLRAFELSCIPKQDGDNNNLKSGSDAMMMMSGKWFISSLTVSITSSEPARALELLLASPSMAYAKELHLMRGCDEFYTQDVLSSLSAHGENLQHLHTLTLLYFPTKTTGKSSPQEDLNSKKSPSSTSTTSPTTSIPDPSSPHDSGYSEDILPHSRSHSGDGDGVLQLLKSVAKRCKKLRTVVDYAEGKTRYGAGFCTYDVRRLKLGGGEVDVKWKMGRVGAERVD